MGLGAGLIWWAMLAAPEGAEVDAAMERVLAADKYQTELPLERAPEPLRPAPERRRPTRETRFDPEPVDGDALRPVGSALLFRGRTVVVLAAVTGVSFLAAILCWIFGPELLPARSSKADSFSRSALGHRAFAELLREPDVPTVVSRFNSGGRARRSALLIVAEPWVGSDQRERMLRSMISQAHRALLVLPEWRGVESEKEPGFIELAELIRADEVEEVLDAIGADADVVRPPPGERVS